MTGDLLPWRLSGTQWAAAALAVAALAGLAWFLTYETERDRLDDLLETTLAALEEGNVDAAMEGVSPEFESYGLNRAELRKLVETTLRRYGRSDLSVLQKEFRVGESYASCRFTLLAWGVESGRRPARTKWLVSFRKTGNRWRIIGLESRSGLDAYLRRAEALADQIDIELVPEE